MSSAPRHFNRQNGFTLVEILTVISIVAVVAILSMPLLNRQMEKARGMRCLSRLRQISVYFNAYAADNRMTVRFMRDGTTSRMWYDQLKQHAKLTEREAQKAFGCPSIPEQNVNNWYCYGFRLSQLGNDDPGRVDRPSNTAYFEIPLLNVKNPSRYFLFADSGTKSRTGQTFRIIPPGIYSGGGVKTRHSERAHLLFLDGHVEALDSAGLAQLGFTKVFNQEGQEVSIK